MSSEPAFLRVLRESVEAEVTASVASAARYAALASWGQRVPGSFAEVLASAKLSYLGFVTEHGVAPILGLIRSGAG